MDIRARMTSRKYGVNKKSIHFSIPSLKSLLKTIERFPKFSYKVGVIMNIARKFHEYLFLKILVQEEGFNIHMMDLPSM